MRSHLNRWLILTACGFAGLPLLADIPDPGTMALAASQPNLRAVDESVSEKAPMPIEVTPPKAAPIPSSVTKPNESLKTIPTPAAKALASTVTTDTASTITASTETASTETVPDDGAYSDTLNTPVPKAAPDAQVKPLGAFAHVDYLRSHNDTSMAISYLKELVTNQNLLPQERARVIVELADTLESSHQEAESLCWLKIWTQMYPSRPEFGAVAYRIGTIYTHMGLSDLARDAYYMTLAHSVNDGQVQSAEDLKQYTRLTVGTLWALSANEYAAGQWERAAELFARYRVEATTGTPASMEKAAFLQADCYYQLKQTDKALSLYEETLQKHPFNVLAPQARLRLYHLYVITKAPEKAKEELEALAWTVRTVWPQQETYWQKQTGELLLALNQKNGDVLPPLFKATTKLSHEGKSWQDAINHYDALVSYQLTAKQGIMDSNVNSSGKVEGQHRLREEDELLAMNKSMDQLLPPSGN